MVKKDEAVVVLRELPADVGAKGVGASEQRPPCCVALNLKTKC